MQNTEDCSASTLKSNENFSVMQSNNAYPSGCNELACQNMVTERFSGETNAAQKSEQELLQNIPQNLLSIDSHSSFYDEIMNFITTKTFPDNSSLSYKMLLKKRARSYSISEGTLFYGTKRVLQTRAEQLQILKDTHVEEKTGIHLGVKKMSLIINAWCFWRGQYVDIANFVRQCTKCREICNFSSERNLEHEADVQDSSVSGESETWQKVEVNLHGPFCKEDGQAVYIATIIDPVSRYVVAKLVAVKDCPEHLSYLILNTFCTFGVVKCYLNDTCKKYLDVVKLALKQHDDLIAKLKITSRFSFEDFVFDLPQGEEECSWIKTCLEPYVSNFVPLRETELCVYIFELNAKITSSCPFMRMFNRNPYINMQDDKENADINLSQNRMEGYRISHRRLLRSSVLQCRHCEEVFTSKISFRIHQRKHTEEAHRRGILEGQTKCFGVRERKVLRKSVSKQHITAKRQRSSQNDGNPFEGRSQLSIHTEVPEHRRAELRASTVEAVKQLVARKRDNKRKRRGKYKKFPSDVQEQMARYAIDHGTLLTVRHFSEKLGVVVSESTVRNIVKWYQCFTSEVKDEIGRFAAAFGVEAAASHFSKRLGRDVRFGLIHKFKKMYLSRYSEAKLLSNEKKHDKTKLNSTNRGMNVHSDVSLYCSEMKEEIGCYAFEHSIPVTIDYFSRQFNLNLDENIVLKFKKLYQDKLKSNQVQQSQMQQTQQHQKQHVNLDLQTQELSLHQQSLEQLSFSQTQHSSHIQHQHDQVQQPHLHLLPQQQQSQHQNLQQQHQHHQQQLHQQQTELQQHEPLPCDTNGVALLSFQHQTNSSLQEATLQSSNQTIDILQTSLNLLNNPQLNNSTAIIYNTPFPIPSSSHVTSNQLIPANSQQNTHLTFQASNHNNEDNISTAGSLSYPSQEAPIPASVIINQNVATVQSFPNPQVYPAFAQTHAVQPSALVSNHNLPLHSTGTQLPSLSHHPSQLPSHSGLPTITVAVTPLPADPHFQAANSQSAVVLPQPVPQSILVSHSQTGTTLLQHIIDSQSHIQAASAQMPQHMMNEVRAPNSDSTRPYPQFLNQPQTITSETFSHELQGNIPTTSVETPASFEIENKSTHAAATSSLCTDRMEMNTSKNYTEQLQGLEIQASLAKITDKSESNSRDSLSNSQQYESESDHVNTKDSSRNKNNLRKVDRSYNSSDQEKSEICFASDNGHSKTLVRKNIRKKEKNTISKGKGKTCEQKRGSYTIYSPEIRAEMGKYAADHGCQKACDYFHNKHGYNVAESTMRSLRSKYLKKRELCSQQNNGEVTSLGYAPRGRPMYLGQYDEVVQECMRELVKTGEKITSFLAIATAKHVLMQFEPHLLEENGGRIKLNDTWAKSFLKRSGFKNYS